MTMRVHVFWNTTQCSFVGRFQRFGGTCCLHLQGEREEGKRLIYLGDGDKTLPWKVDTYILTTRLHIPECCNLILSRVCSSTLDAFLYGPNFRQILKLLYFYLLCLNFFTYNSRKSCSSSVVSIWTYPLFSGLLAFYNKFSWTLLFHPFQSNATACFFQYEYLLPSLRSYVSPSVERY
jgi:hypothetical protein